MNAPLPKIETQKVKTPIQLLAAWLVGLIVVNGAFLATASSLDSSWERTILVSASVVNVPLFLVAIFLLQTKFRPELQEDSFYSQYLDKKTNEIVRLPIEKVFEKELNSLRQEINFIRVATAVTPSGERRNDLRVGGKGREVALNEHLPDFGSIRKILKEKGIPLADVFGKGEQVPSARVIALAEYMDFPCKIDALRLACEAKMDGYLYFNPQEEFIDESILIGSYGDAEYSINERLRSLLESDPEEVDLKIFERDQKKQV